LNQGCRSSAMLCGPWSALPVIGAERSPPYYGPVVEACHDHFRRCQRRAWMGHPNG
jgi:hypothetical protein